MYERIKEHIGHQLEAVAYADGENVAIECIDCSFVIIDIYEHDDEPDEDA